MGQGHEAVAVRHLEYGILEGPFCVNNHGMYDEIESAEKMVSLGQR